jgi:ABC-type transport system involved in multi-copper enzyme maturation permease subunit
VFVGLIALVVAGAVFITAEYRRGMIRITLAASPRRSRVLAAKAIVLGVVSFVATLIGAAGAILIGDRLLSGNGYAIYPASATTEVQVIAGTAALAAFAAIFALGVGAIVRNGAVAVTIVITAIILPYVLAVTFNVLSAGASDWLMRVTPAAAFAIQQAIPAYAQVSGSYTPNEGYFPLAPWAGFAVLCGYAVLAVALGAFLLRRRDA